MTFGPADDKGWPDYDCTPRVAEPSRLLKILIRILDLGVYLRSDDLCGKKQLYLPMMHVPCIWSDIYSIALV